MWYSTVIGTILHSCTYKISKVCPNKFAQNVHSNFFKKNARGGGARLLARPETLTHAGSGSAGSLGRGGFFQPAGLPVIKYVFIIASPSG